jgi:hypothetical protein
MICSITDGHKVEFSSHRERLATGRAGQFSSDAARLNTPGMRLLIIFRKVSGLQNADSAEKTDHENREKGQLIHNYTIIWRSNMKSLVFLPLLSRRRQ